MFIKQLRPESYTTTVTEQDWTDQDFLSAVSVIGNTLKKDHTTGCVNCTGTEYPRRIQLGSNGYVPAAIMFYFYFGIWPTPRLRFLCGNPRCCNMYHLWIGDESDMVLDVEWRATYGKIVHVPKDYFTVEDRDFRRAWPSPAHYLQRYVQHLFDQAAQLATQKGVS